MNCTDFMSLTKSQEINISESSSFFSPMEHMNFDNKYSMPASLSYKRNRRYFAIRPISSSTIILKQQKSEKIKTENECTNADNTYYLNTYFNEDDKANLYYKKRRIDFKNENDYDNHNHKKSIQQIKEEKHKDQFDTSLSPLLQTFQQNNNNTNFNNLDDIWCEKYQTSKNSKLNHQNNSPISDSTLSRNCSPFSPLAISPSSSGIGSSVNTSATTFSEQNVNANTNQATSPSSSSSLFSPMFNLSNLMQLAKSMNSDLNLLENTQSVMNSVSNCSSDNNKQKIKFSIDNILQSEENDFNKIPKSFYDSLLIKNLYSTDKISSLLTSKLESLVPSTSVLPSIPPKSSNFFNSIPNQLTKNNNEVLSKLIHAPTDANRFPAWIFCTRYSDRPSSGSRTRKTKRKATINASNVALKNIINKTIVDNDITIEDEKRPRTAFTVEQLERLKQQFVDSRYLTEKRRQELAHELGLNESQIKIWFQNKRAKLKKNANTVITVADAQPPKMPVAINATINSSIAAIQLMQNFYQSSQSPNILSKY